MATVSPRGAAVKRDTDTYWRGVKMGLEPHLVPEGFASSGRNLRFNDGVPESRKGRMKVSWMNKIVAGTARPWASVHGKPAKFREPATKVEYTLIAAEGGVYACRANNAPMAVTMPAGVVLVDGVSFVSAPEAIVLLRGPDSAPLVMTSLVEGFKASTKVDTWAVTIDVVGNRVYLPDHFFNPHDLIRFAATVGPGGVTLGERVYVKRALDNDYFTVSLTEGGAEVDFNSAGQDVTVSVIDGTVGMPGGFYGFHAVNRLFVIVGEIIYASDILDYTRHLVWEALRIQQGGAEDLVVATTFGEKTIIALKRYSVAKVTGVTASLQGMEQGPVTRLYGCVSALTGKDVGTDFLWLSQEGVASLTLTMFNEIQAQQGALAGKPPMFSDDIRPLIERIAWPHAGGACDEYWNQNYYLAAPIDQAEVLGPELSPVGAQYGFGGTYVVQTVVGATYRFEKWDGTLDSGVIQNGAELWTSAGEFVALGTSVTVNGSALATITMSIRRVYKGVNNVIFVYSFRNKAWAGYDDAEGIATKYLFTAPYVGRERLWEVTHEGWINLYEEDFEDQLAVPYVDVEVTAGPAVGNTIRVNSGNTITAVNDSINTGTNWGISLSLASDAKNLFHDAITIGYSQNFGGSFWTAPNTLALKLPTLADPTGAAGVRFYGTNGVMPVVDTTGSWATTTYTTHQPVIAEFASRGYEDAEGRSTKPRWLNCYLETWNPVLDFEVVPEGVNATRALRSGVTRDRRGWWKPFDRARRDPTNADSDALDPYRKDYSEPGTGEVEEGGGVNGDLFQESREAFKLTGRLRSALLKVTCRQGAMRIMKCGIEGKSVEERGGSRNN